MPVDGGTTAASRDYSLTREKPLTLSGNSPHRARLRRPRQTYSGLSSRVDSSPLVCLTLSSHRLLLFFPSARVDFFPPPVVCALSPLFLAPSVIPLVFPPPSSRRRSLIPTGVVIPPPRRRLNDFILPRLCLLPLMMCLLPSHFDVEIPQSAAVCLCQCVLEAEDEGVMFEQFRKGWGGEKKKNREVGKKSEFTQKLRLFMCCQRAFPRDHRTAGLKT